MGLWSFYFFGKLLLYLWGALRFHFFLNLLFIGFLVLPVPATLPHRRTLKTVKTVSSFVFGFLLLWHDSYFPPPMSTLKTFRQIGIPEKEYMYRLVIDAINPTVIIMLIVILALCIYLNKRIKLTPIVVVLALLVPIFEFTQKKEGLTEYLSAFHHSESGRTVSFQQPETKGPDFDILILHICSLSWDDLRAVEQENHAFLRDFDILFTNFNSVSSYTNPSAIRLLRANCGQQKHEALYQDAPRECFLLENLRALGYETHTAIDNDAPAYQFVDDIMRYGKASAPIPLKGIPVQQYDFDRTPIYNDLRILERWWGMRQESGADRAVLYFDITTLHGGAHWAGEKEWWKRDRPTLYKEFLLNLFTNLDKFFQDLKSSGKNFVVIFVPEHGMALRGTTIQGPDIRDIPLPQITTIPVGIKLIGSGRPDLPAQQIILDTPSSYLALSHILASFLKEPPFNDVDVPIKSYVNDLPETKFVAENQEALVVKKRTDFYLFGKGKTWSKLPTTAVQ
jgi:cellulose synthase operon protein YhjU